MSYVIKCDECKTTIGETDDLGVSAAGGRCQACKPIPYGEPCGMCGRAAETPWTDEEYACYECAGDPKAKSVRKRLGWAACMFYDARIPILASRLNAENRARFLRMKYAAKCNIIGKMIERGNMI